MKSPAHFRRDGRAFERPEVGEPAGPRSTRVAREAGFCEGCEVTPVKSPALPPAEVARNAQGRDKCRAGVPWPVREALTNSDATALRIFTKAGRGDSCEVIGAPEGTAGRPAAPRTPGALRMVGCSSPRGSTRLPLRGHRRYPAETSRAALAISGATARKARRGRRGGCASASPPARRYSAGEVAGVTP